MEEAIEIKISFTGLIDVKCYASGDTIQVDRGTDIKSLLSTLGIREQHKRFLIVIVNEKKQSLNYVLQDKDHVALFLPIGGG